MALFSKRHFGYLFWTVGENVLNLGITRILLFPLAAYIVGKELFGVFVTAYSIVAILGNAPAGGLGMGVLRQIASHPQEKYHRFYSTAIGLCRSVMIIFVLALLFSVAVAAMLKLVPSQLLFCVAPLVITLYSENQFEIIMTKFRVERLFRQRTIWTGIRVFSLLIGGIVGAFMFGIMGLACGYAIGSVASFAILRLKQEKNTTSDPEIAKALKKVWLHLMIAFILGFSRVYISRIVVSLQCGYLAVSDFYGATSVINLYLIPAICGSSLLMSMLGKYTRLSELSYQARLQCLLGAGGAAIFLPLLLWKSGPFVLHLLFPEFGENTERLLAITTWALPFGIVFMALRPFLYKFAPVHYIPIANTVIALGYIVPTIVFIILWGVRGAAFSFVCGNVISVLTILIALHYTRRSKRCEY